MASSTVHRLLQLPKKQRLEIAEQLWISVADEAAMPVPATHKKVLRDRLSEYRAGRAETVSTEELIRRVRSE
jgi:putative addiction module component (TIGR02574 family)